MQRTILVAFLASIFTLSLTRLWEQDIFWQVRAGWEILQTGQLQDTERWSYTAAGEAWLNLQWLTTIWTALTYQLAGANGLIVLRAVLILGLFALLARYLRLTHPHLTPGQRVASMAVAYVAMSGRLQLRADLVNFILFTAALVVWRLPYTTLFRRFASLVIITLAANTHPGTAPFVMLAVAVSSWNDAARWWRYVGWLAICGLAFFVTPYHVGTLPFLVEHFFYFDTAGYQNPDHQPLQLHHFSGTARFAAMFMSGLLAARLAADCRAIRHGAAGWLGLGFTTILAYLCWSRVRAFPYATIWSLPAFSLGLATLSRALLNRTGWGGARYLWAPVTLIALAAYMANPLPWGFSLWPKWPVKTAAFIAQHHLSPEIYHGPTLGSYTVWFLKQYKTFSDTRETPFRDVDRLRKLANNDPHLFHQLVERFNINVSLMPIPHSAYAKSHNIDVFERFYPASEWALVALSRHNVVFVRRIPGHRAVIEDHEYRLLKPTLSPFLYLSLPGRSATSDARFRAELERCLAFDPMNVYCLVAWTRFLRTTGAPDTQLRRARQQLDELLAAIPRHEPWRQEALAELHELTE